MRTKPALVFRHAAFAVLGVFYGYLLWAQILPLPNVVTNWLVQGTTSVLKAATESFSLVLPYDAMLALISFSAAIPNTIFVAALVGLTVHRFGHQRLLMYSVLVWPVLLHALHWFYVSYMEYMAAQGEMNPALASYKENYFFPSKALTILFIYSLFFVLACLISHIAGPSMHNPAVHRTLRDEAAQRR